MDKCVALTVLLALCIQLAAAGRYFRNDGQGFHHSFERGDPHKWHHERPNWEAGRGFPHKFHKPRQQESSSSGSGSEDFWHSHEPEGWASHSQSGSWEYPDFPPHHHHPSEWHSHGMSNSDKRPSVNWNQGLPPYHHGGKKPNGNNWNQGGNNQQGSWNQGGNRPNWNQGGSNPNLDPNWQNQPNSDWQNPQGRPNNNNNRPTPTWNQAGPSSNTWGQPTATSATQVPLATTQCIRSCPVTSEFNPVCGTNNVTYANPGRLECAKYCGVDVTIRTKQPCTASNSQNLPPQPTNNPFPDVFSTSPGPRPVDTDPDSKTTSKVTIPQDVLNSIFTSTPSTSLPAGGTDDDNYDIDIRDKESYVS